MSLNEMKKLVEQMLREINTKAPVELSSLVKEKSGTEGLLLGMCSMLISQNEQLTSTVEQLNQTISELQDTIKELKRQLGQNSSNSSKPPSTDGFKKPKPHSLRKKSELKPGGQDKHKGANLSLPHDPDEVKQHLPEKCKTCGNLQACVAAGTVFECSSSRFVIDAKVTTIVTEHQAMMATNCPCGEKRLKGEFPADVKAYVQYGDSFAVIVGLLSTNGAVSVDRIHSIIDSLFNISLSQGTVLSMIRKCASKVNPIMQKVREILQGSDVVHFDETGLYVEGKRFWAHNSSNDKFTYITVHKKRGVEGIEDNGVLSADFKGIAVHDCWMPYWKFEQVIHAICCVHLLRELIGIIEVEPNHKWTEWFKQLLLKMKKAKDKEIEKGKTEASTELIEEFEKEYDWIMELADKECPSPTSSNDGKKGRKKKGKERALIERLKKLKDSVCLFINDFRAPFDNNQAERDVRNVKTKIKVSGCFRTEDGANDYLTITSFLGTAKKHGINAFDALTKAFNGTAEVILG